MERAVILCDDPILQVDSGNTDTPQGSGEVTTASSLDAVQSDEIRRVLDGCNWVIEGANGAAAALGLKPSTLRFRMKRLGIKRSDPTR